jgi:hypothetical protein
MKKLAIFCTLTSCAVGAPAWSASLNPTLDDRVSIRGGPFFANVESNLVIRGQEFKVEDQLDDSKTTAAIALDWRITSRLILIGGYTQVSRSETFGAGTPTGIGGVTIPAGASADVKFKTQNLKANLGYSFVRNHTTEFGASLGLNVLSIEDKVAFTPAGGPTVELVDDDTTQPMPMFGLYLNHAFSRTWMIGARASYLDFDVGDIDGKVVDFFGAVEWRPWQNVGFGVSYVYTDADLTITDESVTAADVSYQYDGPFAYIMLGFGSVR